MDTLNELISQIGEDKRAEIIYKEADLIMAAKEFSIIDAQFLLDVGEVQGAQDYIIGAPRAIRRRAVLSSSAFSGKLGSKKVVFSVGSNIPGLA